MRTTLLLVVLALLCGCSTRQQPSVTPSLKPQAAQPDPIAALVARLSATHGLWINGMFPDLDLPTTASTQQVLEQVFKKTGFDKGNVRTFQIIETRQVQIPATGFSDAFTAVLVETDLGRKIVLLKSSSVSWWSRVYDA
jgi:hypothetical protein